MYAIHPLPKLFALLATAALMLTPYAVSQYAIAPDRTVTIVAGDIYFQVEGQERGEALHLRAGETITLVLRNDGGMPHNFQFGRDLDPQTRRYATELFEGFAGIDIGAGAITRVTLQIPDAPGTWELGCLVLGHYEAGQRLDLVIE